MPRGAGVHQRGLRRPVGSEAVAGRHQPAQQSAGPAADDPHADVQESRMSNPEITDEELQSVIVAKCLRANTFSAQVDAGDLITWVERIAVLAAWLKERRQKK